MKLLWIPLSLALALPAQTTSFEVAAIKPNRSGGGGSSIRAGKGQIGMENVSLRKLTLFAYGIPDDREYALSGPDWLGTERFDILAKFPADTPLDQVRVMLRTMLAERFKLALHRETRMLPAYELVVAKGGPRIQPAEPGQNGTSGRPGRLEATKITMQKLCDLLVRMVGQPVHDATGLNGVYTFTLEWTPDETQKPAGPDEGAASNASGTTLFAALQEQLGLKLQGRKAPAEILVVDRMEKIPTEN